MGNNFQIGEKVYFFLDEETPCHTGTIVELNSSYAKILPDVPRYSLYSVLPISLEQLFRDKEECWKSYDIFVEENKKRIKEKVTSNEALISYMFGLLRLGIAGYSELKAIEEIMEDIYGKIIYGNQY